MSYVHPVRIRYGECDMQRVVFNANYWAYCDDAVDVWVRTALAAETGATLATVDLVSIGFDFMLKSCSGTWHKGAVFGDTPVLGCSVSRWGNTSFDVAITMTVEETPCFDAVIVYVSVDPVTHRPSPIPDIVRRALARDLTVGSESPA